MKTTIQDVLSRLEGREKADDEGQWLDRYLFDREWRADVDAAMALRQARPEMTR